MEKKLILNISLVILFLVSFYVLFPKRFNNSIGELVNFEVVKIDTTDSEIELVDSTKALNYQDINQAFLDSLEEPEIIEKPVFLPPQRKKKVLKPIIYKTCNCPNYSEEQKKITEIFAEARRKLGMKLVVKDTIRLRNSVVKY